MTTSRPVSFLVRPSALRDIVDAEPREPSFKFFPYLPAELQLQIWELAAGKGPAIFIVDFWTKLREDESPKNGEVTWSGAALLSVCSSSRAVATRVWGSNVRHIPSPGTCIFKDFRPNLTVDLATDALYHRSSWPDGIFPYGGDMDYGDHMDVKHSTMALKYESNGKTKCGNKYCHRPSYYGPADYDWHLCINRISKTLGRYKTIRRLLLVVENFGVASAGKRRATGPVYSTIKSSSNYGVPEGTEFYDATDGLVDASRGGLLRVGEGKLEELEDAKGALKKMEERWLQMKADDYYTDCHKDRDVAFRILVGVIPIE